MVWLAVVALLGCGGERACDEERPLGDGRTLCLAVAEGGEALRRGLRGAPQLADDEGMVLRYPVASKACITMKGMTQPIDAWWLDADGRVLRVACGLQPGADPVCQPGTSEVLEMAPRDDCDGFLGWTMGPREGLLGPVAPESVPGEACGSSPELSRVDGRLHLVVHRSELVSEAAVEQLLARAQGYFAPYGLWLTVDEWKALPPATPARPGLHGTKGSDALLDGTRIELLKLLEAEGLPESPTDDAEQSRVDAVVQDLVMGAYKARIRELVGEGSPPPTPGVGPDGRVHVVFLREIARPGSLGEALFQDLRGLTVSPWLAASDPDGHAAMAELLDLPEHYVPVTVVGIDPADRLGKVGAVDLTLAHELGHALGLPHVEGPDLMQEGLHRCIPALRPEQAAALRGHERL